MTRQALAAIAAVIVGVAVLLLIGISQDRAARKARRKDSSKQISKGIALRAVGGDRAAVLEE